MFRNIIFLFIIISIIPGLALSADDSEDLETIIVTASRTPVSTDQIGSSFTIIDAEQLSNRQIAPLSEVLRGVPGFSVSRSGVLGSFTQIRVRGAEANQVLVFIDGVEANDLAQGSAFDFAHLLTSEIERIEIIRGPQSALWGSDALSGVINVTSKRGTGPVTFSGFLEGGSFGTKRGGGNISGSGEKYHFNLGGSIIDSDGENISRQGDEDDGYKNTSLSFSGGYEPTENLSLSVAGRHTDSTKQFDDVDFVTGLQIDADKETDAVQDYGRIQLKLSLFNGQWEHILGSSITSTDNDNFTAGIKTDSTRGKKYRFDYQTNFFLETSDVLNASHTFTFAIDHEKEEFTQHGQIAFGNDPNQDLKLDTTSLVGEYRITIADNLSLSGSIRHDNNSDFDDSTTHRATAAYLFSETGTRLHSSYGTGIKNPGFIERFGFFASSLFSPFVGNPDLKPEQSSGWEIGIEQALFDNNVTIGATYFKEELEDEINGFFFDPITFTTTAINVDGVSKRQGLELSGKAKLPDGLSLSANYTYLDATAPNATGRQVKEIRRPEHMFNANLNYVFLNNKANINFNINYNGEQEDDLFTFKQQVFKQQRVTLDSFTLVSLTGSYQINQNISLYGRVENLLDDDYEEVVGFQTPGLGVFAGVRITLQPQR